MIIKLMPETDEERTRFTENFQSSELVHSGVKEFFIFGNKLLADSQLTDFHEWSGNPRYLMGNLSYFYEVVNDERRSKEQKLPTPLSIAKAQKLQVQEQANTMKFHKYEETVDDVQGKVIKADFPKIVMENRGPKIIKKGEISANIQTIDVENLKKNNTPASTSPRIIQMSELKKIDTDPNKNQSHINPINVETVPNIPAVDTMADDETN